MATVTKKELIDRIAERTQAKRVSVKRIIQTFLDEIVNELCRDNRLEFRDFGVFETRRRASRVAQNPKTLARVEVPMKRTVKFKMGRLMREHLSASVREGESKREFSRLARGSGAAVRKVALGDSSKPEVSDLGARAQSAQAKPSL
jgi:integration host factor subunit beta